MCALRYEYTCPAKINLHLSIGRKQHSAAFHRVVTLLQAVSLGEKGNDFLRLELSGAKVKNMQGCQVRVFHSDNPISCSEEENLVYRAANLYLTTLSQAGYAQNNPFPARVFTFYITKKIPEQAGLGGASSNAAAALLLLDSAKTDLAILPLVAADREEQAKTLLSVAEKIGSDVPFFLQKIAVKSPHPISSLRWGTDRGQVIQAVHPQLQHYLKKKLTPLQLWIVKPKHTFFSTKEMYRMLDHYRSVCPQQYPEEIPSAEELECNFLQHLQSNIEISKKEIELFPFLYNDFFSMLLSQNQALFTESANFIEKEGQYTLATLTNYFYTAGAVWQNLSGSGAAIFVFFRREKDKNEIITTLQNCKIPLEYFSAQLL